jgi:hypothetical protein
MNNLLGFKIYIYDCFLCGKKFNLLNKKLEVKEVHKCCACLLEELAIQRKKLDKGGISKDSVSFYYDYSDFDCEVLWWE